jgi:hypothetical protein
MKYIFLTLFVFILVLNSGAQEKFLFNSQNTIGLLEGGSGSAFQLQTINGIAFKKWFAGLGTGIDYYYIRSVPLFLSANHNFLNKPRTPFVSLDAGANFAWVKKEQEGWGIINSDYSPSLYLGGNAGYKFGLRNNDALLLLVGYSLKELKENREVPTFCINPPCQTTIEKYNYNLRRISLRLGYQF